MLDSDGDGLYDAEETALGTALDDADTDDDGLTDGEEVLVYGTDPLLPDTDGDRLLDGEEVVTTGTDPRLADTDGDGLDDADELETHTTDPLRPDSDDDGLTDGEEVGTTDPNDDDTDDDGLLDGEEVNTYQTDPNDPDSDDDLLSDSEEVLFHGSDPNVADTDGDGLDDGVEVLDLGTDPVLTDTDADGLDDFAEVDVHGTEPTNEDTDADRLLDGDEVTVFLTDPLVFDSDEDGLGDGAEILDHETLPNDPDTDLDGALDGEEVLVGCDPNDPDTDDGLALDGLELSYGTDPNDPSDDDQVLDEDSDDLINRDEAALGTDRSDPDTDDDGALDGEEVHVLGTDPLDPDTDGDGLVDGAEVTAASDPLDTDSDSDGVLDGPEVHQYGSDPIDADSDDGGLEDGVEVRSGLDPTDPSDDAVTQNLTLLFDDMEKGSIDATVWDSQSGVSYQSDFWYRYSEHLMFDGNGDVATTVALDASGCQRLLVVAEVGHSYGGGTLEFSYDDDGTTIDFLVVAASDSEWHTVERLIGDPAAMVADFELTITHIGATKDQPIYLDDLRVVCDPGFGDADGDGVADYADCNDNDDQHWLDCGQCVDNDGDAHGSGCDLGPDCDDADADVNPGAGDAFGDGEDTDCSGADGVRWFDDFESGRLAPPMWTTTTEVYGVDVSTDAKISDAYGLDLRSYVAVTTAPLDTSGCETVAYSFDTKVSAIWASTETPARAEFFDGTEWVPVDSVAGDISVFPKKLVSGDIADPRAFSEDFAFRLRTTTVSNHTDFFFDDLEVGCGGADDDGDLIANDNDCDDTDADLWDACGICTDSDGDGFGEGCDRGEDCDDADDTVHPGAADALGDGDDDDCSGSDGPGLADDFEGPLGYAFTPWAGATPSNLIVKPKEGVSGTQGVRVNGGAELHLRPIDLSACEAVEVSLKAKINFGGGSSAPQLWVEAYDHGTWRTLVTGDRDWASWRSLNAAVPYDAYTNGDDGLRVRIRSGESSGYFWLIDDFEVGCGGSDSDGDGWPDDLDCDDTNAHQWLSCDTCVDADGDGHGAGCDLTLDCDDADASVYGGAPETWGDGVDSDCDGTDGAGLNDTFGSYDDHLEWWPQGRPGIIGRNETYESTSLDFDSCERVHWAYGAVMDFALNDDPMTLEVSIWDGAQWTVVDRLESRPIDDEAVYHREGQFELPAVPDDIQIRFAAVHDDPEPGRMLLDYAVLQCVTDDDDGDGVPVELDCDDADDTAWSRCDTCVDLDGDGFGLDCDLGLDCNDDDDAIYPGANGDSLSDGIDQDCDGGDGDAMLSDGFETGRPDPTQWSIERGAVGFPDVPHDGAWSARLAGDVWLQSTKIDATGCTDVAWSVELRLGDGLGGDYPATPAGDGSDSLYLMYDSGSGYQEALEVESTGYLRPYQHYAGLLPKGSNVSDLRFRLEGTIDEAFVIDDVSVGCSDPDDDDDGYPSAVDCDDTDEGVWEACGHCVDDDGDGFGAGCDQGDDCDDSSASSYPGASDSEGDGVDQDCSGGDGPGFYDGFELGRLDPRIWDLTATVPSSVPLETWMFADDYGLYVPLSGASLETQDLDTTSCDPVLVSARVYDAGWSGYADDDLFFEWWDGKTWQEATHAVRTDRWERYVVLIEDTAAQSTSFRLRLRASGSGAAWWVDELFVGCGGADSDGDGFPVAVDCDDADADAWTSCACVDNDGDGYGEACDRGPDCDDADDLVNPGISDALGDGVDDDCSGVDGPGLFLDFENEVDGIAAMVGESIYFDTSDSYAGTTSMVLDGASQILEFLPQDYGSCSAMSWDFRFAGEVSVPAGSRQLRLEARTDEGWELLRYIYPSSIPSTGWGHAYTVGSNTPYLLDGLRLRLRTQSTDSAVLDWRVDDVAISCDEDGDTLPDSLEVAVYGTDPDLADTDADGVDDDDEVRRNHTDPLDPLDF